MGKPTLHRVTVLTNGVFFGFVEASYNKTNFASQAITNRFASLYENMERSKEIFQRIKTQHNVDLTNAEQVAKAKLPYDVVFPQLSTIDLCIDYDYITADEYAALNEASRRSYLPVLSTASRFFKQDAKTGEILRDKDGRAIVESVESGYFTDESGKVLFRRGMLNDERTDKKLTLKKWASIDVNSLPESALEACMSRLAPAEAETATLVGAEV